MPSRQQVVDEARKCLGIPWKHQGRSQQGIDCAGLIIIIAHSLNISTFDTKDYGRIPDGTSILQLCREHLVELPRSAQLRIGQILLMRFEQLPQHLGIVGTYPIPGESSLIHAYAGAHKCVEHRLDSVWTQRILYKFDFHNTEDGN